VDQPNLLFVFSDQHRWCDLGCYGNSEVHSPGFDAFAAQSVRFEHCISNSPLCVPARGSLLTGLLPLRHGAVSNDLSIRHDVASIAHVLDGAGYETGYIGKWHLAGVPRDQVVPPGPARLGFQEWKVNNCSHRYSDTYYHDEENRRHAISGYEPVSQTDLAIDFLRRRRDGPWGLVLSWGPPHEPYHDVPARHLERYRQRALALRRNVPAMICDRRDRTLSSGDVLEHLRGYYAHITALDEQFTRLLAALEASGQRGNTIVVYTSDHGDMLGSQGFTNKQLPYDEAIRVPLMIRWPERTFIGVSHALLGLTDLPVSVLGLMGLLYPGSVDGCDFHLAFCDPRVPGAEECYVFDYIPCHQAYRRGGEAWRALRTVRHTIARKADGSDWLLFDNVLDPWQLENLAGRPQHAALQRELGQRLARQIEQHDRLLPGDEFIRHFSLKEKWNRSQVHFGLPVLE
jgi:arylsulfatase A-like enzyme